MHSLFDTIVVPLDGGPHTEVALHPAVTLATQANASLVLVSVAPPWDVKDREDNLRMAAVGLPVPAERIVLQPGPAADMIVELLRERGGCLPCMASHGRGFLGQAIFGDVSARVVRESGGPVLAIGPHVAAGVGAFTEVVVAVDGSDASATILPTAIQFAQQIDAKVRIVQVVDPDDVAQMVASGVPENDVLDSGAVATLAHLVPHDVSATWDVLHHEDPGHGLVDYLSGHLTAIVAMSTHSRSGFDLLTEGSVANHVVHSTPCPVMLMHPPAP